MFEKQESKLISLLTASLFFTLEKEEIKGPWMLPVLQLTFDEWKHLQFRPWWAGGLVNRGFGRAWLEPKLVAVAASYP